MFFRLIDEGSRINTNLFVLQCVSFCRVLDLSCSLCPSINSVSADFTSSWCSSSLRLIGIFQHLLLNCSGRSFTEKWKKVKVTWHVAKYGDPYSELVLCIYPSKVHTHIPKVWLFWEELHWRCDCCGRSFTEGVIVVGGASLTEEQICKNEW